MSFACVCWSLSLSYATTFRSFPDQADRCDSARPLSLDRTAARGWSKGRYGCGCCFEQDQRDGMHSKGLWSQRASATYIADRAINVSACRDGSASSCFASQRSNTPSTIRNESCLFRSISRTRRSHQSGRTTIIAQHVSRYCRTASFPST